MLIAQQDSRPLIEFTLSPLFEDYGIPLAIMGVLVVFVALVLIALFITLLPYVFGENAAKTNAPSSASHLGGGILDQDDLSEETLVVIAAAVAETIRTPHRIVRIQGEMAQEWTLGGRMQHHQSHKIQHRNQR